MHQWTVFYLHCPMKYILCASKYWIRKIVHTILIQQWNSFLSFLSHFFARMSLVCFLVWKMKTYMWHAQPRYTYTPSVKPTKNRGLFIKNMHSLNPCYFLKFNLINLFFIQQVLISYLFYTYQCIYVNPNRPIHHTTTITPVTFPPCKPMLFWLNKNILVFLHFITFYTLDDFQYI